MARTTFGRSGEAISIDEPKDRKPIVFEYVDSGESVAIDGNGNVEHATARGTGDAEGGTGNAESESATDSGYTDPATAAVPRTKRKYTKRAGTGKADGQNVRKAVTANLTNLLVGIHALAAEFLSEPEIAIDEDEAKLLNEATIKLATEYGLGAVVSPKRQATVEFVIAIGMVYGVRTKRIIQKHSKKRGQLTQMPQRNVN